MTDTRERHCDAECPRCLTHADIDDEAAPGMTGFTTEGEIRVQQWQADGEHGTLHDVGVNFWCPVCQVSWTGHVEVGPDD